MSYHLDIGPRARAAGRLISSVRDHLAAAIAEERDRTGLSNRALARKLGIRQSVLTKILSGEATLTLRALAEIGWALERRLSFRFQPVAPPPPGANGGGPWTNLATPTLIAGDSRGTSSTLPTARPITGRCGDERESRRR